MVDPDDFTRTETVWQLFLFVLYTLLIKVVLVVVFLVQAMQAHVTVLDLGYIALSLYFLIEPRQLERKGNRVFRWLVWYNVLVLGIMFFYQVRARPK